MVRSGTSHLITLRALENNLDQSLARSTRHCSNSIQDATLAKTKLSKIVAQEPSRNKCDRLTRLSVDRGRIQRLVETGLWPLGTHGPRASRPCCTGAAICAAAETGNLTRQTFCVKSNSRRAFPCRPPKCFLRSDPPDRSHYSPRQKTLPGQALADRPAGPLFATLGAVLDSIGPVRVRKGRAGREPRPSASTNAERKSTAHPARCSFAMA
jgi:hypothetical protein